MRTILCLLFFAAVYGCDLQSQQVEEAYHPEKPIDFPHSKHSAFDCKVCHNSAAKSKTDELPTVNVCANCHRGDGRISVDSSIYNPDGASNK